MDDRRNVQMNHRVAEYIALLILVMIPLSACYRPGPFLSSIEDSKTTTDSKTILRRGLTAEEVRFDPKTKPISEVNKERRDLTGLGSSPPQCTSKCGRCTPCDAVHVPIQPGLIRTTEYYPEAWRCKCGNKVYMP